MKIKDYFSPNFDEKNRSKNTIKILVIHYTGMQSERESLKRLCNSKSKVSSHYLINRIGKIYRLVKENKTAWHAGKSCWGKYKNLNKSSIGIELVNKGHRFGYTNFSTRQIISLKKISKIIIKKYKIKNKNIVGHSDIAPLRKVDPGEKFPWKYFAKKKIGIWHYCKLETLKKERKVRILDNKKKVKFMKCLKKIGYCFPNNKKLFFKIIKAFQMHYRNELVNGILDKECLIIAQNLTKRL
tara:strand:+ start:687 stop:1409 length:723 start_codon:yes stop_codon:yes gene_type:complete